MAVMRMKPVVMVVAVMMMMAAVPVISPVGLGMGIAHHSADDGSGGSAFPFGNAPDIVADDAASQRACGSSAAASMAYVRIRMRSHAAGEHRREAKKQENSHIHKWSLFWDEDGKRFS